MEMYSIITFSFISAVLLAMIMIIYYSKGTDQNEKEN